MSIFSCFPKKEELIKRTYEIDLTLYENLEYLSQEIYDASINKLINLSLDDLFHSKKFNLYKRPKNEITVIRSILIRKSLYENMIKYKKAYNLSYNKIINIAIRNALIKEGLIKDKQ